MGKKTPKKVMLKDKDVPARKAKKVQGGALNAYMPAATSKGAENLSINFSKIDVCPSDPSLNFKKL